MHAPEKGYKEPGFRNSTRFQTVLLLQRFAVPLFYTSARRDIFSENRLKRLKQLDLKNIPFPELDPKTNQLKSCI